MDGVSDYHYLTDGQLHNYVDSKCKESNKNLNISDLEALIKRGLIMYMAVKYELKDMKILFVV